MRRIRVKTGSPYDILIAGGLLTDIPENIKVLDLARRFAVISDSNVAHLLGEDLVRLLEEAGLSAHLFTFPAGEESKNIDTVVFLARQMLQSGFDRKCAVVALGGGVTGDLAGFLASIYLRGIPYVQVPTSLLAQVDSSVGGKTGVDLPEGKNLLGTFYQPRRVYIDYGVLTTLPLEHLKNGLAEVVKYGCIWNSYLFSFLEEQAEAILAYNADDLEHLIYESCRIKAEIVSQDEKEGGLRRVLNFGHTIGHALEAAAKYKLLHGFCVSIGMVAAARISEILGIGSLGLAHRIESLLKNLGLPVRIPRSVSVADIMTYLSKDKKVWQGKLTLVLLKEIGKFVFYEDPPQETIQKVLEDLKTV